MHDASSWDRNPLVGYLTPQPSSFSALVREFWRLPYNIYIIGNREFSIHEKSYCISAYMVVTRVLYQQGGGAYICHPQAVLLYHNSSLWLDTWDASIWDRNLADFTSVWYVTPVSPPFSAFMREFLIMFNTLSKWCFKKLIVPLISLKYADCVLCRSISSSFFLKNMTLDALIWD